MARKKNQSDFFKVKQVCLTGLTLKRFEKDLKQKEMQASTLLREIIKSHYDKLAKD